MPPVLMDLLTGSKFFLIEGLSKLLECFQPLKKIILFTIDLTENLAFWGLFLVLREF